MTLRSVEVDVELRMHTGAVTSRVTAVLRYEPVDPFAVKLAFVTDDGTIEWLFARDLLRQGMAQSAGSGDVRIWPAEDGSAEVFLELSSPTGQARFSAPAKVVSRFIEASLDSVRAGRESEQYDWDVTLLTLLSGDAQEG